MRIAVAGGTGTVGRHVVAAAQARGHDVTVLSRGAGVDVLAGTNLDSALAGVSVVIDVLNLTSLSKLKSVAFFERATQNLLRAEARAGASHHVALSIVGIDRIDASYYAGKLAQERLVNSSDVPHTVARAGQFHEFAEQVVGQATFGGVSVVPRLLGRPVAASEVAGHLISIAEGEPLGRASDLVGPRNETLADMVRRMYTHDGVRRRVLEARLPGPYGRGLASGDLRGSGSVTVAKVGFDEWLSSGHRRR